MATKGRRTIKSRRESISAHNRTIKRRRESISSRGPKTVGDIIEEASKPGKSIKQGIGIAATLAGPGKFFKAGKIFKRGSTGKKGKSIAAKPKPTLEQKARQRLKAKKQEFDEMIARNRAKAPRVSARELEFDRKLIKAGLKAKPKAGLPPTPKLRGGPPTPPKLPPTPKLRTGNALKRSKSVAEISKKKLAPGTGTPIPKNDTVAKIMRDDKAGKLSQAAKMERLQKADKALVKSEKKLSGLRDPRTERLLKIEKAKRLEDIRKSNQAVAESRRRLGQTVPGKNRVSPADQGITAARKDVALARNPRLKADPLSGKLTTTVTGKSRGPRPGGPKRNKRVTSDEAIRRSNATRDKGIAAKRATRARKAKLQREGPSLIAPVPKGKLKRPAGSRKPSGRPKKGSGGKTGDVLGQTARMDRRKALKDAALEKRARKSLENVKTNPSAKTVEKRIRKLKLKASRKAKQGGGTGPSPSTFGLTGRKINPKNPL